MGKTTKESETSKEEDEKLLIKEENKSDAAGSDEEQQQDDDAPPPTEPLKESDTTAAVAAVPPSLQRGNESHPGAFAVPGSGLLSSDDEEAQTSLMTNAPQESARTNQRGATATTNTQSSDVTASSSDADLPRAQQVPIDAELVSADVESANIHSGSINRSNSMLVKAKPMDENNTDEITLRDVWKNRTVRIIVVSVLVIAFCLVVGLSVGLSIHEAREGSSDDP